MDMSWHRCKLPRKRRWKIGLVAACEVCEVLFVLKREEDERGTWLVWRPVNAKG